MISPIAALRLAAMAAVLLFALPAVATAQDAPAAEATEPAAAALVNINTADVPALTALPGIGKAIAQRIVEYREANGKFATVDDLTKVKGIGQKKLETLKPLITVGE